MPIISVDQPRHHVKKRQGKNLQLDFGAPVTVGLSGVEHVDSALESEFDDVLGRISTNLATNGEP